MQIPNYHDMPTSKVQLTKDLIRCLEFLVLILCFSIFGPQNYKPTKKQDVKNLICELGPTLGFTL